MMMTNADFEFIRSFVRRQSAIALDADKAYLVESRLASLLPREGIDSINTLVQRLRDQPTGQLRQRLIEAMTTNETSFFRDSLPFEALQKHILPEMIEARLRRQTLYIWCAACSTGQEPYSVAMIIKEHFPELANWKIQISATDISTEVLERAKAGLFNSVEIGRGLTPQLQAKYFQRVGLEWRVVDALRSMIEFRHVNLIESYGILPTFDIVFLRNVLIYFDVESKRKILGKVSKQMSPDGFLFLGGAETTVNVDDSFQRVVNGRYSWYRRA